MRITLLSILLCMLGVPLMAQQTLSYTRVDSLSYAQYIKGDAKGLRHTVKKAAQNNIDYYYLRMRAGIVHYNKGNYELAAVHFKKAATFFPADTLAAEYLYNAYKFTGRSFDANKAAKRLLPSQKNRLGANLKGIQSLSALGGYVISNNKQLNGNIALWGSGNLFGEDRMLNNYALGQASMVNNLSKNIKLISAYTYVNLQNTYRVQGAVIDSSYDYVTNQHDLYLAPVFNLGKGFYISPAVHYTTYGYTSYKRDYSTGIPTNKIENVKGSLLYTGIETGYRFTYGGIALAGGRSKYNGQPNYFHGSASLVYYPLGNRNLYGVSSVLYLNDSLDNYFVFTQKLGFKLANKLWAETGFATGQLRYFADDNGFTIYNIPDEITMKLSATLNFFVSKHLSINATYAYMQRQGLYTRSYGPSYTEYTTTNYTNHLIVTGITYTP